jgi:hypothetical protein
MRIGEADEGIARCSNDRPRLHRRELLRLGVAASVALAATPALAAVRRLVFVHGRSQQGRNPVVLKAEWLDALRRGAQTLGRAFPDGIDVAFPYYGDKLDELSRAFNIRLASEVRSRSDSPDENEFLVFQAEVAEAIRQRAGVTDEEVDREYGPNPRPRGPLNWEWVQAILRALDKHGGGMSQRALEVFTRDVFLYTTRAGVRDEIDGIVSAALTGEPAVVVGHSLGSVVTYSVLRSDTRQLSVPLCVTVGSPLGIRPIRNQFRPLKSPKPVETWYNAFDPRDVVALFPLDEANFPITPRIENYAMVQNHTDNRHGIIGYLDDRDVAGRILAAVQP